MKQRVLIVDDSLTTLVHYAAILEDAGFEVETCDNVWIASVVAQFRPDVLVMDVNLGTIAKGDVAVKTLANRPFMRGVKVLLHSSLRADELEWIAAECGAHGFVRKSEDGEALLRAIAEVIALDETRSGWLAAGS
jgi:CheY-like chemotaxis protein